MRKRGWQKRRNVLGINLHKWKSIKLHPVSRNNPYQQQTWRNQLMFCIMLSFFLPLLLGEFIKNERRRCILCVYNCVRLGDSLGGRRAAALFTVWKVVGLMYLFRNRFHSVSLINFKFVMFYSQILYDKYAIITMCIFIIFFFVITNYLMLLLLIC